MHIGTVYSFSFIFRDGTTAKGRDTFPITFYIIELAFYVEIPPEFNSFSFKSTPLRSSTEFLLPSTLIL